MSIKEQFEQTEKLYHFTKFDTALKIIESNRLRFGRLDNMNDIHENDKMEFVDANNHIINEFPSEVLNALHDEIYKYRQISLTAEGEPGDKLGFDLHQMWGLYADKGEGVCLVFDKNELAKWLDVGMGQERVSYDDTIESFFISFSNDPQKVPDEVRDHINDIFYHKRKEWEHEQEFRLLKRCPVTTKEEYLWYGKALKYIILSSKLRNVDEVRYFKSIADIKAKAKNIPVLIYGNGLFDYALVTSDQDLIIWDSTNEYDTLNYAEMRTKYAKEQLTKLSFEELLEKTRDRAVDIHLNNGRLIQLCVNDLLGFDKERSSYYTRTGIKINQIDVESIEVIDGV
jgi:hypothetical protein